MPSERVQWRIDRFLDQADEALEANAWQKTVEICRAVLKLDGENADAASFLEAAEEAIEAGTASTPPRASEEITPSTTIDQLPTSFTNGRFVVKSLIGEGGKKRVYLTHGTTLDRDVAFGLIKSEGLDADARQRITREAQAMGRLGDHPNIMPIHDLGDEIGQPYLVQPLMNGGDVGALIEAADDGRLPPEDALRLAAEICSGLEFAHSKGIIHRDLKLGNVWLTSGGNARIGDFGLALSIDRSRLTQEKMMVGTVSYMPPEQATGGEVTEQADLY